MSKSLSHNLSISCFASNLKERTKIKTGFTRFEEHLTNLLIAGIQDVIETLLQQWYNARTKFINLLM